MQLIIIKKVEYTLNILAVTGISLVLLMAFFFQFALHELPCPLCSLQRIGFTLIGIGFLLNLRFGLRPSHYAISLLSAIFTAFAASRQVLLHIVPGTGNYGSPIFGLHMYTWTFILCVLVIIGTTFMLSIDRQYAPATKQNTTYKKTTFILFLIFFLIAVVNGVASWAECGWTECSDNPMSYLHSINLAF